MSSMSSPPLLDETLRLVARRYRLPPLADAMSRIQEASASTTLALAIEAARSAIERGSAPDSTSKRLFIEALARLIHDAMRTEAGDPVFQAMVLRHHAAEVREYASVSAHETQDRRAVRVAVDSIAHPRKQERIEHARQREALARLHAAGSSESASGLFDTVRSLLNMPEIANDSSLGRGLTQLRDSAALERLRRLEALETEETVREYRSLWDRSGPRPGSETAVARGVEAKRRGAAMEASAARALEALALRLKEAHGRPASYWVVTSMRVPASIPGSHARAKTEWDAVLLRSAQTSDAALVWDVCLFVEAKASVDAATTDFARLLRGLRLLAHAEAHIDYAFDTQQGMFLIRGASLSALRTDEAALERTVLYCCDAPVERAPRLLSAAGRMQLLSAPASLEFAGTLMNEHRADNRDLEPVWDALLESPQWAAVLNQYPMLCQVRELMVHPEDLLCAIAG